MALIDSLVVFAVSLAIGTLGIYTGARLVTGEEDFGYALLTALIGGLVWAIAGFFLGWIPLLGPLLAFLIWLGFINARYEGGLISAILISIIAWITVIVIFYILGALDLASFGAIGIPGI